MTWKGTDHIHCCTQIINPGEEKKKKRRRKKKNNFPTAWAHMHVHVRSGTAEHMGLGGPAALLPEKKKKGPKQTGRGGARLLALAGLDADAWCGVDEAAAPRRAPATGCKHSGGRACAHPPVRSASRAEADHVLRRAGREPSPNKRRLHQLVSPPVGWGAPRPLAGGVFIRLVASSQLNSKCFCPSGAELVKKHNYIQIM